MQKSEAVVWRSSNSEWWKDSDADRNSSSFFSQRACDIDEWNKLPPQVVNAPSVNSFKSELENHWKRYGVLNASS